MTTAVNINTQLYNQVYQYAKKHNTSVDRMVESFIISTLNIPADEDKEDAKSEAYCELMDRLREMSELEADWDDEGALPINKDVINTVRLLIDADRGDAMSQWIIFPDTNGTLMLDAKHRKATISIGIDKYSYVYHGKGFDESSNNEKLTIEALIKLIRHINE
ncbi:MAG: hypothetical protein IJT98_01125 [Prevotella sp.]|nr:hypothetical protein [Prevotella sp.]